VRTQYIPFTHTGRGGTACNVPGRWHGILRGQDRPRTRVPAAGFRVRQLAARVRGSAAAAREMRQRVGVSAGRFPSELPPTGKVWYTSTEGSHLAVSAGQRQRILDNLVRSALLPIPPAICHRHLPRACVSALLCLAEGTRGRERTVFCVHRGFAQPVILECHHIL
jgi:hypothetical protein